MFETIKQNGIIFYFNSRDVFLFCHLPPGLYYVFQMILFFFKFYFFVILRGCVRYLIEIVGDCNIKAEIVKNIYFTTGYISNRRETKNRGEGDHFLF